MSPVALQDVIDVRGRFHRSTHVTRDWEDKKKLSEYLLTKTGREISMQVLSAVSTPGGERAWSITGPYGTGKSSFALFLADLLSRKAPIHPDARVLRRDNAAEQTLFSPILIVGQRATVSSVILTALVEKIKPLSLSLARSLRRAARNPQITDAEVVALTEQVAKTIYEREGKGLLVILDEFGKLLEYASVHSDVADLQLMQQLAETAARSAIPMLLVTILHSSFAEYLHTANQTQRREWQKVQGRFVDIAFQETPDQLLRLIGAAIEYSAVNGLQAAYRQETSKIVQASGLAEARARFALDDLLPKCIPLHPITALLLWPVFRSKLAQNERSLFAFLTGREPFGFQEFLSVARWDGGTLPFYKVEQLYDYVVTSLGHAVYLGDRAHRWAEMESAIDRVPASAPASCRAIIKTIGMLGMYGASVGLRASKELLNLAFQDTPDVVDTLSYLERTSIIVFRRHEGAYGLWEGSDIDLDACVEEARRHIGQQNLAARLKQATTLRSVVARAHYIRTGTLRYFSVDVTDGDRDSIHMALQRPLLPADGQILFVLAPSQVDRTAMIEAVRTSVDFTSPDNLLKLIGFPEPIAGLQEALEEVEIWNWIRDNVPALQGDSVARQEVRMRLIHAKLQLEQIAGQVLGLHGQLFDPGLSVWLQGGVPQKPRSGKEFLQWLSTLCDTVFDDAPVLRNELLNRDHLSSAAVKARHLLLEAMISHEKEPALGLSGTPPEVSMYRTMLESGSFHRKTRGQWSFVRPGRKWRPVWKALEVFLQSSRENRRPVPELFKVLRQAPFGLRDGPLPILLCAYLLAHKEDVALYEEGVFVPELRIEVLERLGRRPASFELQQYAMSREDRNAFKCIGNVIRTLDLQPEDKKARQLLQVTKPLIVFAARLPQYSRNTRRLTPESAIPVRDALLAARDPRSLLFVELPSALGLPRKSKWSRALAARLNECLLGLQRAYPYLLDQIEAQFRVAFDLQGTSEQIRQKLSMRAAPLAGHAADRTLSLFVKEAGHLDSRDWRETLARIIMGGMPANQWHDTDVVTFQLRLTQLASDFVRLEELVTEQHLTGASLILRIGLLDGQVSEARDVIALTPDRAPAITTLANRLAALLDEVHDESEETRRIRLAAIAQVAAQYLPKNGKDSK